MAVVTLDIASDHQWEVLYINNRLGESDIFILQLLGIET